MSSNKYTFKVAMTCEGCSNAVQRVLDRVKGQGVEDFNIDLPGQLVTVTSSLPSDEVLNIIKKTGKSTELVPAK